MISIYQVYKKWYQVLFKEEKIPLFVRLPKSLVNSFRDYVSMKYSTDRYGWQSYEIELALKHHLAIQNTQHQNPQILNCKENKNFKIRNVMEQINRYFINIELYTEPPKFIPEKHLNQAIADLHGTDKRTIAKWRDLLLKYGHIKRSGMFQFEILSWTIKIAICGSSIKQQPMEKLCSFDDNWKL
jgi:hypothetical protein